MGHFFGYQMAITLANDLTQADKTAMFSCMQSQQQSTRVKFVESALKRNHSCQELHDNVLIMKSARPC